MEVVLLPNRRFGLQSNLFAASSGECTPTIALLSLSLENNRSYTLKVMHSNRVRDYETPIPLLSFSFILNKLNSLPGIGFSL